MAIDQNNSSAMNNLGLLYEAQRKFNLAIKYYIKALSFDANVMQNIVAIMPKVSQETQLLVLELVPQIRTMNEIIHIPPTVYFQFTNKKIKISRYLARYLIDDIVDICLAYY
jgi:tetratricopeptide (TPR) repeat protein